MTGLVDRNGKPLSIGDRVQCGCCGELATVIDDAGLPELMTDSGWRDLIPSNVVLVEVSS